VRKIIKEILLLVWKVFRLVLWKWLKPILGKVLFFGMIAVAVAAVLVLVVKGC
jgi:hypothetical protein